ncbi:MAG: hypothetical protein BA864_09810 [Desulfuromonadales bacterium C00003093]|nr:MAG: hypothetical protein BA864_09810 [Desulfuromonadales bacterium C00003093]
MIFVTGSLLVDVLKDIALKFSQKKGLAAVAFGPFHEVLCALEGTVRKGVFEVHVVSIRFLKDCDDIFSEDQFLIRRDDENLDR